MAGGGRGSRSGTDLTPRFAVSEIKLQQGSEHDDGVVDLLGMLAYATLTGFFRLSGDAALAAALPDKVALAEMAVAEHGHFRQVLRRLEELDADADAAMKPFVHALDAFHARTHPADWIDTNRSNFVVARVHEAIVADPPVAGRLALWARRIVGEALGQAQRVAAEREPLARLLAGGDPSQLGKKFAKLTDGLSGRMAALGLANQSTWRPSATLPAGRS